jgi:hypothetical protein
MGQLPNSFTGLKVFQCDRSHKPQGAQYAVYLLLSWSSRKTSNKISLTTKIRSEINNGRIYYRPAVRMG